MSVRCAPSVFRIGSALALVLVLAGCTAGGQFDPTEMFNSDMFNTKKKIPGDREPLFPEGVPGTASGVPQDLVKGYQPPPDQAADNAGGTGPAAAQEAEKPKPKPKPKPKLARAPAGQDAAFDQKRPPTRISVGPKTAAPAEPAVPQSQTAWPTPPQNGPAQVGGPAWPAPPTAPAQQTAQPAQSGQAVWPNPPPPGKFSQ